MADKKLSLLAEASYPVDLTNAYVYVVSNLLPGQQFKAKLSQVLLSPLGAISVTSVNNLTVTQPATGSTLTIADGKTATFNNTLAFTGTDGTTMTLPSTSDTLAGIGTANTFTAVQTNQISDAVVNATTVVHQFYHKHASGTPTTNFGTGVDFFGDTATVNNRQMGRLYFKWSTATDATRNSKFIVQTNHLGVVADALTVDTSGNLTMAGNVTGTIVSATSTCTAASFSASLSSGFQMSDLGQSGNFLIIANSDTYTANRTLTLSLGDASANLTLTGSATLNQDVSTAGSPVFTGLGIGAAASAALSNNPPIHTLVYMTWTTAPATGNVAALQYSYFALTPTDNTTVQTATFGDIQINGNVTPANAGHSLGGIFRATDTSSNTVYQFSGLEGKRVCLGATDSGQAVWGITDYNMASASGRTAVCFNAWAEFFNGTPSSPIATGHFIAYNVTTPTGGDSTGFYALFAPKNFQIQVGSTITINDQATPTNHILTIQSNQVSGADGLIATSGNLYFNPTGGTTAVVGSLLAFTNGSALGSGANLWALGATTGTFTGKVTKYNNVTLAGWGLPGIEALGVVAGASAAGTITGATVTVGAADGLFEVSGNLNVTAATAVSTSINCAYTDETNVSRTMIIPISGLAGSFLAGGLATSTGPFEGTVMTIRCKASTTITISIAAGTFTGVTYDAYATIKQVG